jgi:CarD family transcriptional regulator
VHVPTCRAAGNGLRGLSPPDRARDVFRVLRGPTELPQEKHWNRRQRAVTLRMRTGDLLEMAAVVRDLSTLARHKEELASGEQQLLSHARSLVVCEVAAALSRSVDEIDSDLALALEGPS